jgi:hypothetical protein
MEKRFNKLIVIGSVMALLGAFVMLTPSSAAAQGVKAYPGIFCRYYSMIGNDTFFNPSGYGANGLKNIATAAKYVSCPVIKVGDGYEDVVGSVQIFIQHASTATVTCSLISKNPLNVGETKASPIKAQASSEAGTTHWYSYTWNFSTGWDTTDATYSIYCSLPASSAVMSYWINPYL